MIHKAAILFSDWMLKNSDPSYEAKREIYVYGVECALSDLIQTLWLVFIGLIMGSDCFDCAVCPCIRPH